MSFQTTLILLIIALALTVFTGWRGARAPDPHRGPRMAPWRFLMLLFATLSFFLLIHLASMAGLAHPSATGQ